MTLSISQVAAFAQVTVRTVRHYHDIGLLPEPRRDACDRRVYQPEDALRLARIRSLIDAGFSLPDVLDVMREHHIDQIARTEAVVDDAETTEYFREMWHALCVLLPPETIDAYAETELRLLADSEYCYWLRRAAELKHAELNDPRIDEVVEVSLALARRLTPDESLEAISYGPVVDALMDRLPPVYLEINRRVNEAFA